MREDIVLQIEGQIVNAGGSVPSGGLTGQVLTKKTDADFDTWWVTPSGEGGGAGSYAELPDKPTIEGVTVEGNRSAEDLKLASRQYVETEIGNIEVLLGTI